MNEKLEEAVHDIKTPGLNNSETYVLTDNRFNSFLVLTFSDLNETQIHKMPNKSTSHHQNGKIMISNYLSLSKLNEHTEDCQIRKPNDFSTFHWFKQSSV